MRWSKTTARAVFYGATVVVVVGVLAQLFAEVLPDRVASGIGHNSEGVVLALLLALWIELARPRLAGTNREWPVTLVVAAICTISALLLLQSDLPSRFRTLNETFLAAAVVIPYLQLRRPLPDRLAIAASAGVLAAVVVGNRTGVVIDLAEALAVLVLVPIGFDLVDRGILDPQARTSPRLRLGWYVGLVVAPIVFSVLEYQVGFDGILGEATRYSVRVAEAFIAMLLVELYLTVGLGRVGQGGNLVGRGDSAGHAPVTAPVTAPGDTSGSSVPAPPG
jgi:hypothetical protein